MASSPSNFDISTLPDLGAPAETTDGILTRDMSKAVGTKTSLVPFSANYKQVLNGQGGWTDMSAQSVDTMSDLLTSSTAFNCVTFGFYSAGDGGGAAYYWSATTPKTDHNGVTIIDPGASVIPGATGWWTTTSTSGTGCWVSAEKIIDVRMAGAKPDDPSYDSVFALRSAISTVSLYKLSGVYLPKGTTYVFDKFYMESNVTLFGDGKESVIKATFPVWDNAYNCVITSPADEVKNSVTFKDFFLDLSDVNTQSGFMLGGINNLTIDGIHTTAQDSPAITYGAILVSMTRWETPCTRSTNVIVKNCVIDKPGTFGIVLNNVDGGLITDNIITNSHREAIGLEPWEADYASSPPDPVSVKNVIVSNNVIMVTEFSYNPGGSTSDPAVTIGGANSQGYVGNILVIGNTILCQEPSIGATYRGMVVVGGNILYAEDISVIGNTIRNTNGASIQVGVGGYKTRKVQVSGNMLIDANQGQVSGTPVVNLTDAVDTVVAHNIFRGSLHDFQVREYLGGSGNIIAGNKGDAGQIRNIQLYLADTIIDGYEMAGRGQLKTEVVTMADGDTHTFAPRGSINRALYFLSTDLGPDANAIFGCDNTAGTISMSSGSKVSFGITNPAVAGNINIWPGSTTEISIQNLLGSTREVTLFSVSNAVPY